MKKAIIFFCIALCLAILLSSCSLFFGRERMSDYDSHREKMMKVLIEAIKSEDRDTVRAMFSEKALREAEDFEASLDELFEYIQGEIVSFEKAGPAGNHLARREGKTRIELPYYYYIYTTEEKYYISMRDFYIDEIDPENEGLYILYLVKVEDEEKLYDKDLEIMFRWGKEGESQTVKIDRAGICVPFFDEEESSEITVKTE